MNEQKTVSEIEGRVQSLKGLIIFLFEEKKRYHQEGSYYESYVRKILGNVLRNNAKKLAELVKELKKLKRETQKPKDEPLIQEIKKGLDEYFDEMRGN